MIDIIIKSFNRPHYLDRCLSSIQQYVTGNYQIKVIDDGTPAKYLEKIKTKYPQVKIIKTLNYEKKNEAILKNLKTGEKIDGFNIPISDWKKVVSESSDYFLMTEDDVWFTKDIDIDTLEHLMKTHQTSLLKIGWISTRKTSASVIKQEKNIEFLNPNLFTAPKFFMDCFFENKYKLFSILYRLKIVDNQTKSNYWILNALLTGLWDKKYWLTVWSTLDQKVNELEQLKNASSWYHKRKNKNPYLYAKLDELVIKTTFKSSATNSYHEHYGINLDINMFNYILNEAWYNDVLDSIEDLPSDISSEKIKELLIHHQNPNCTVELWEKWTQQFKAQYIKQGVDVD